jgi:hypothetical protein
MAEEGFIQLFSRFNLSGYAAVSASHLLEHKLHAELSSDLACQMHMIMFWLMLYGLHGDSG